MDNKLNNRKKGKKNKKVLYISIIIVVLAAGGFGYYWFTDDKTVEEITYQTGDVKKGNLLLSLDNSGVIEYGDINEIYSSANGTISDIYISDNSSIQTGDSVVKLDDSDIQIQIEQAYNDLKIAQLKLADLLQTTVDKIAQISLDDLATVKAPSNGIVSYSISESSYITTANQAMTLQDTKKMYFVVGLNNEKVKSVEVGQEAEIHLFDYSGDITGTVERISNTAHSDGSTMVYDTYILVDNPGMLESGDEGSAKIMSSIGEINESGQFEKMDSITIYSNLNGDIEDIYVKEGEYVTKGTPLFKVDNTTLVNQIETQKAQIENIELRIKQLEEDLENTTVKSSYAGYIDDVYVTQNQQISTSTKLAKVVSEDLIAKIEIDELDISMVELGQLVELFIPGYSNDYIDGEVIYISDEGIVKDGVTSYEVYISFEQNEKIKSGMTVDASIIIAKAENVLMVPSTSIIDVKDGKAVRVLEGEDIVVKKVETGISNDTMTEIKSGIELTDIIITSLTYNTTADSTSPSSSLMPTSTNIPGISGPGGGGAGGGK